jgi:hypothetical protein
MKIVQIEIPDELAEKLAPYQGNLSELLEIGLKERQARENQEQLALTQRIRQALADSGLVRVPQTYSGDKPYERHTPVEIEGEPVSEIVIRQRDPL